jgi:hypothetical protein
VTRALGVAILLLVTSGRLEAQDRPPSETAGSVPDATEDASSPIQTTDVWRPPTLTTERYNEDWSKLANPDNRTGRWTEPFKYVPLSSSGNVYLTTGVELRERYEGYENLDWGSAPDQGYLWSRLMPYADLHVGNVRFFAQPIVAISNGVKPRPGPVDETGVDLLQGFADVVQELGPQTTLRVEVGRQLFGLGTERLVGTRYGPNVPLAFDGARAILHHRRERLIVLFQRPVESGPRDFDDHSSHDRAIWGAYATHWFDAGQAVGVDYYFLGFRDDKANVQQGGGREVRQTYGTRWFGSASGWHWNIEAAVQTGHFAGHRIRAWSVANEVGRSFGNLPFAPDITFRADVASGDKNSLSPEMEGFNPLFAKGKYFGVLSPLGPRNLIDAHPAVTFTLDRDVSLGFAGIAYWRQSQGDGIYDTPGHLLRPGGLSDALFVGVEAEVALQWQATPELSLSTSIAAFAPGAFIRQTGPARTIRMLGLESNFRF